MIKEILCQSSALGTVVIDEMDKLYILMMLAFLIKQGGAQRNQCSIITEVLVDKQRVRNNKAQINEADGE